MNRIKKNKQSLNFCLKKYEILINEMIFYINVIVCCEKKNSNNRSSVREFGMNELIR